MRRLIVILVVLAMLLSLSACIPKIKTEDGEISFKDGKLQIKTDEGTTTISEEGIQGEDNEGNTVFESNQGGTKLPEGFPTDVCPIIDGSSIVLASKQSVAEGVEYWLTIQNKKDMTEIMDFYKNIMEHAEDKQVVESNDMNMIIGMKDGYQVALTLFPEGENDEGYKTVLSVSIIEYND